MNVGSILDSDTLAVDPIVSVKKKADADQAAPQIPFSPSTIKTSPAITSPLPGSLLSSSSVAEVLKLTDTTSINQPKTKTISHEDVINAVKRSKSYAAGNASDGERLGEIYTSSDVGFIKATTGYNVISIGGLTAIVDDDGNGAPSGVMENSLTQIAGAIERDRSSGALTGDITPEYAKNMISTYAGLIKSFPEDWLDKALSFLGSSSNTKDNATSNNNYADPATTSKSAAV